MSNRTPTLAEMEDSLNNSTTSDILAEVGLEHALADDVSAPKPSSTSKAISTSKSKGDGKKGKGKSDFDESKVKRDGEGRFAKQASSNLDLKDKAWLKGMTKDRLNSLIYEKGGEASVLALMEKAITKAGLNKDSKDLNSVPKEVVRKVYKDFTDSVNEKLIPSIREFKSPSGNSYVKAVSTRDSVELRIFDRKTGRSTNPAPIRIRPNAVDSRMRHSESPSLSEMRYILENDGEMLSHFGIKGMKWGVRRSRKELARLKGEDGEDVGGLRASTRKAANRLRSMVPGETIVIDDGEKGPRIYTKQPDGTFKQTHLAADTERFMRTLSKDPSEMSTKEIQDATKRAQAIDAYNKLFNPYGDPNYNLRLQAEAMKLKAEYQKAYSQLHPPKPSAAKRLSNFIEDVQPTWSVFKALDKSTNHALSKNFKAMFDAVNGSSETTSDSKPSNPFTSSKRPKAEPYSSKSRPDVVYNITDLGKDDYLNPFIAELEGRKR